MSGGYRWGRLIILIAAAIAGWAWLYMAWTWPDAPRLFVALATVFGLAGIAATLFLALSLWIVIVDDVRPRIHVGRPDMPISIAHREAALVGRRRFRHHAIKGWTVLTFGGRVVIGVMVCSEPEWIDMREDDRG